MQILAILRRGCNRYVEDHGLDLVDRHGTRRCIAR